MRTASRAGRAAAWHWSRARVDANAPVWQVAHKTFFSSADLKKAIRWSVATTRLRHPRRSFISTKNAAGQGIRVTPMWCVACSQAGVSSGSRNAIAFAGTHLCSTLLAP
jgi:hypothetical protein